MMISLLNVCVLALMPWHAVPVSLSERNMTLTTPESCPMGFTDISENENLIVTWSGTYVYNCRVSIRGKGSSDVNHQICISAIIFNVDCDTKVKYYGSYESPEPVAVFNCDSAPQPVCYLGDFAIVEISTHQESEGQIQLSFTLETIIGEEEEIRIPEVAAIAIGLAVLVLFLIGLFILLCILNIGRK